VLQRIALFGQTDSGRIFRIVRAPSCPGRPARNVDISAAAFGSISGSQPARSIQFGPRLTFCMFSLLLEP
jgi:hypothetical protein